MVNTETIIRASNVIAIKGMSFSGLSSKKIKKVPIEFSESDPIISNCSAGNYYAYKNGVNPDRWCQGINTIDKQIDIVTPYNNGAKYIYVLSTGFLTHGYETVGSITGPLSFLKYTDKWGVVSKAPITIKFHATDYNVANNNGFDNKILECYYPLDDVISNGATKAVISYCAEPGPYTASGSQPYTFVNTIIDKPIAYFVYDE